MSKRSGYLIEYVSTLSGHFFQFCYTLVPGPLRAAIGVQIQILLILLKSMIADGFQTELCNHGNLTKLERKLQTCLEEMDYSGDGGQDFCSPFQVTKECLSSNLRECFIADDVPCKDQQRKH